MALHREGEHYYYCIICGSNRNFALRCTVVSAKIALRVQQRLRLRTQAKSNNKRRRKFIEINHLPQKMRCSRRRHRRHRTFPVFVSTASSLLSSACEIFAYSFEFGSVSVWSTTADERESKQNAIDRATFCRFLLRIREPRSTYNTINDDFIFLSARAHGQLVHASFRLATI